MAGDKVVFRMVGEIQKHSNAPGGVLCKEGRELCELPDLILRMFQVQQGVPYRITIEELESVAWNRSSTDYLD